MKLLVEFVEILVHAFTRDERHLTVRNRIIWRMAHNADVMTAMAMSGFHIPAVLIPRCRLPISTHIASAVTVSLFYDTKAFFTYRSPHFCFPWRRLCDHHAICCMDGKISKM